MPYKSLRGWKPVRTPYILVAAIDSIVAEGAKGTCVIETY